MWVVESSDKSGLPCGEVQSRGAPCSEQGWGCPQTGTPGLGQLGRWGSLFCHILGANQQLLPIPRARQ